MRYLFLCLGILIASLSFDASAGKKVTINVIPETAKIYVDGQLVGNGSYKVDFKKDVDFFVIKVEDEGYITRTFRLLKSNPKNTVLYQLPEDEAFEASAGADEGMDLANRWFDVTCRKDMSEDIIWKRLMSVATNYFDNIEVRDKTAGWIKSSWRLTKFRFQTVRTRMEVRLNFTDENALSYRVRISVQIKDNECRGRGDNCYKNYDRVLRTFEPLVQELQTSVGSGD